MHTIVEMAGGRISLRLVADQRYNVSTERWREDVQAGLAFQLVRGGGFMLLVHQLEDIVDA